MIKITIKAGSMYELLSVIGHYIDNYATVQLSKIKEKAYGYQVYITLPSLQEKAKTAII